jgi:hypothetical protein
LRRESSCDLGWDGDNSVKAELDIAAEHVNGSKVYMGDIHNAARAYARSHIVAPGIKADHERSRS